MFLGGGNGTWQDIIIINIKNSVMCIYLTNSTTNNRELTAFESIFILREHKKIYEVSIAVFIIALKDSVFCISTNLYKLYYSVRFSALFLSIMADDSVSK